MYFKWPPWMGLLGERSQLLISVLHFFFVVVEPYLQRVFGMGRSTFTFGTFVGSFHSH